MNYRDLIQNRKSVRAFTDREVSFDKLQALKEYYQRRVRRLVPEIETQLYIFGGGTRNVLEGSAGYHQFLVGAPQYLVLMSEAHPLTHLNAGFVMEDLILKVTEMGLDSCWMTFVSSEDVKAALGIESGMEVAAIAAFGHGQKTVRRLRLNIRSMSNVDVAAKHQYMEPKKSIRELAFWEEWGNSDGLYDHIGFFDDMLWEALYAAALAPSYLNRQAYGFLLDSGTVRLVRREDAYNTEIDGDLSLGAVLLHFDAVASDWAGKLSWRFGADAEAGKLPAGCAVVASADL